MAPTPASPSKGSSSGNPLPKHRQRRPPDPRSAWTTHDAPDENTPPHKLTTQQKQIYHQKQHFNNSITLSSSPRPASPSQAGTSTAVVFRGAHYGLTRPQLGKASGRARRSHSPRLPSPPRDRFDWADATLAGHEGQLQFSRSTCSHPGHAEPEATWQPPPGRSLSRSERANLPPSAREYPDQLAHVLSLVSPTWGFDTVYTQLSAYQPFKKPLDDFKTTYSTVKRKGHFGLIVGQCSGCGDGDKGDFVKLTKILIDHSAHLGVKLGLIDVFNKQHSGGCTKSKADSRADEAIFGQLLATLVRASANSQRYFKGFYCSGMVATRAVGLLERTLTPTPLKPDFAPPAATPAAAQPASRPIAVASHHFCLTRLPGQKAGVRRQIQSSISAAALSATFGRFINSINSDLSLSWSSLYRQIPGLLSAADLAHQLESLALPEDPSEFGDDDWLWLGRESSCFEWKFERWLVGQEEFDARVRKSGSVATALEAVFQEVLHSSQARTGLRHLLRQISDLCNPTVGIKPNIKHPLGNTKPQLCLPRHIPKGMDADQAFNPSQASSPINTDRTDLRSLDLKCWIDSSFVINLETKSGTPASFEVTPVSNPHLSRHWLVEAYDWSQEDPLHRSINFGALLSGILEYKKDPSIYTPPNSTPSPAVLDRLNHLALEPELKGHTLDVLCGMILGLRPYYNAAVKCNQYDYKGQHCTKPRAIQMIIDRRTAPPPPAVLGDAQLLTVGSVAQLAAQRNKIWLGYAAKAIPVQNSAGGVNILKGKSDWTPVNGQPSKTQLADLVHSIGYVPGPALDRLLVKLSPFTGTNATAEQRALL